MCMCVCWGCPEMSILNSKALLLTINVSSATQRNYISQNPLSRQVLNQSQPRTGTG